MPPRSSWKGFIRLSLVSVPIKAYTATSSSAEIRLNQLHEECNSRVKYKKVCPIHGDIANDEIVSGYEYTKGSYVVVDPGELEKLRTENDRSVGIDGFISPEAVDPIYYAGKTHYLVPDGPVGQKPYALLVKAMHDENLFAIAQTVLGGREQVVLLRPKENMIVLTVLQYPNKVKSLNGFQDEIVDSEITDEEMKLTKTLIDATIKDDFEYSKYTDKYIEKLSTLINAKVEGQEVVQVPDPEEPKIINLMEALKKSVAEVQSGGDGGKKKKAAKKSAKKVSRKMAPSAKAKPAAKKKKKSG